MKKENETALLTILFASGLALIVYFVLNPAQAATSGSAAVPLNTSTAAMLPSYNPSAMGGSVANPNGLYQNVDAALNYLTGHTYIPLFGLLGFSSLYSTWGSGLYTAQNSVGYAVG